MAGNRAGCDFCAFHNICGVDKRFPKCPCKTCIIKMMCEWSCNDAHLFYNKAHNIRVKIEDEEDRFKNL